jgi:hypothetical protein
MDNVQKLNNIIKIKHLKYITVSEPVKLIWSIRNNLIFMGLLRNGVPQAYIVSV